MNKQRLDVFLLLLFKLKRQGDGEEGVKHETRYELSAVPVTVLIWPNETLLPRHKRAEKANKGRSCATIGKKKRKKSSGSDSITFGPPDPAAHNAAETGGIRWAQRSLGGN